MNGTLKKFLNSDTICFICSPVANSRQRVRVVKSGSTETSSVDLQGLIKKALDITINVYSNSDIVPSAVCIKCYKSLVKYQKVEENDKERKAEQKSAYSESGKCVRLLRTENINELTPGRSVKKHLSFVGLNELLRLIRIPT